MQLLVSSPWWFIVFCFLAGFGYAYLLYKSQIAQISHKIMAVLRFISVTLICFFLLGPVLMQFTTDVQKPKILMVLDNSESVMSGKEAAYYRDEFLKIWYAAGSKLGNDYDVEFLNFGGTVTRSDSAGFNQKKTNMSAVFDHINNTYARQNIGAVVLAGDGIYNRGNNPVYKSLNKHPVLYSIGMGDTSIRKDIMIREASHNALAYLNNRFPIEIGIAAYECSGSNSTLSLVSEGKTLYSQTISIGQKDFYKSVLIELDADKPGTRHIIATLSTVSGEVSIINNRKDIFIDIIDGREKILLAYQGPHPDLGAIKSAISANQNYEVKALPVQDIRVSELSDYSVAILHQLPGKGSNARDLIAQLRKLQIPIWSIAGYQSAVEQMPMIAPAARIDRSQGRFNESQAMLNPDFNTFTLDAVTAASLAEFPPLIVPYGQYAGAGNTEILAFQKIGQVLTRNPLWAFSNQNGEKTAYLFGEGFWRWRLADFNRNASHNASNELVSKTIQYLAVKEDKRKFRAYPVKNLYDEDEAVRFIAELYNASYEPVNDAEVRLSLLNADKKQFNYIFSKNGKRYQLDLGLLPPGAYTYTARAEGISETISGKLLISPLQTELVNTRADFALLRQLSATHGGKFFTARELDKAIDAVRSNQSIGSVSFKERKPDELINVKWVFFLLILLISAEWFIRKYEGAY